MKTAYGYAISNNKSDQASSIASVWAIYHHMIMGPPEDFQPAMDRFPKHKHKMYAKQSHTITINDIFMRYCFFIV